MKLSAIQIDSAAAEQGDWVSDIPTLPGIRIKARGSQNKDYRLLEAKLVRGLTQEDRDGDGAVLPEALDRIAAALLLETVVLDVDGFTEDDGTTPIAYTKDLGKKLLFDPDFTAFREGCAHAGQVMAKRKKATAAAEAKN